MRVLQAVSAMRVFDWRDALDVEGRDARFASGVSAIRVLMSLYHVSGITCTWRSNAMRASNHYEGICGQNRMVGTENLLPAEYADRCECSIGLIRHVEK